MPLSLEVGPNPDVVGFVAGWRLAFAPDDADGRPNWNDTFEVSRDQYYASIETQRTASSTPGTFTLVVHGMTDEHWGTVVNTTTPRLWVRIDLRWSDVADEYVEVMRGRIRDVQRTTGDFQYLARFSGVDWVSYALTTPCTDLDATATTVSQAAQALADHAGIAAVVRDDTVPATLASSFGSLRRSGTVGDAFRALAEVAHEGDTNERLPLTIGRMGIHLGAWTAPLELDGGSHDLTLATGLVEQVAERSAGRPERGRPTLLTGETDALRYRLTLLGRPDIQPGDAVAFEVEEPAAVADTLGSSFGALGSLAEAFASLAAASGSATLTTFRAASVTHRLSRESGFVTTVLAEPTPSSDARTESRDRAERLDHDEVSRAASAIAAHARSARDARTPLEVGDVAAQTTRAGDTPAQRVGLQEGLAPYAGTHRAVGADRTEDPTHVDAAPYLTPFAFGSTGLVVPHYPGMRGAALHRDGLTGEAIFAGALWRSGEEPESEPGDWWLSLPTGVGERSTLDDSRDAEAPSGPATHDLIDGDGYRVIHVRGFSIIIGESEMPEVGTRPTPPTAESIEIRHTSGSRIAIDDQGNITIDAGDGTLTLKGQRIDAITGSVMEVKSG